MDEAKYGLRDRDFNDWVVATQLPLLASLRKVGRDSDFRVELNNLITRIWTVVRIDLALGQNPALTDWRLDQFLDWFDSEVAAKYPFSFGGTRGLLPKFDVTEAL